MTRRLALLALLTLPAGLFAPALASAKAVEDLRLDADAQDVVVTVIADQALRAPSIRTSAGSVRVRFYDAEDTKLVKLAGDGGAIRSLELSRGSDGTAALMVMLGDRTKLSAADVRIELDGDTATLRIARGLLPALRELAPASPVAAARATPVAAAALKPAPAPAPAPTHAPLPAAVPAKRSEPSAMPSAASPGLALALGAKKAAPKAAEPPLKLASSEGSPVPMLLAISALLALAYGVLQLMLRKKKLAGHEIPAIDVLAQRRLGPRHQLVIVRAFDRDYLLSVQGGQTTVIARSTRKAHAPLEESSLPSLPPVTAASSALASPVRGERARELFEDDEPTFGGELFRQALAQRERTREQTQSVRTESARSAAQSELARSVAQNELARASRESDLLVPAPVPVPGSALVDSVSGLMRLRKQSGR